MPSFLELTAQHPILCALARNLSTVDLLHLALTCHENYASILASKQVFKILQRQCLCDGSGLKRRQDGTGLYPSRWSYTWGSNCKIWVDEPIEVRLWATKCDAANALPCRKCGINVCEECRYYRREKPSRPNRRPHLNSSWQLEEVMCLCPPCDEKLEETAIRGRFLNELCDCDAYTRWICHKCKVEENKFTRDYMKHHTYGVYIGSAGYEPQEGDPRYELESKVMGDHQHDRTMFCPCGAGVPDETVPRCTWCKRRHLPEREWYREWQDIGSKMPFFDDDPCYPPYIGSDYADCTEVPFADTGYRGPIWVVPEH